MNENEAKELVLNLINRINADNNQPEREDARHYVDRDQRGEKELYLATGGAHDGKLQGIYFGNQGKLLRQFYRPKMWRSIYMFLDGWNKCSHLLGGTDETE